YAAGEDLNEGILYRSIWYAAWEALSRFPDDPHADEWLWKAAYYMTLSGDAELAIRIYADRLGTALNAQGLSFGELPDWFKSGEAVSSIFSPEYTLMIEPITIPGHDSNFIVSIGHINDVETPGISCYLVMKEANQVKVDIIYNGYPTFGYFAMLRNNGFCYPKDVTGDGVDEIIVEQAGGGRLSSATLKVIDISTSPYTSLAFYNGQEEFIYDWIEDISLENGKYYINISKEYGLCDLTRNESLLWNGAWFELSSGSVLFSRSTDYSCQSDITLFGNDLPVQDTLSVVSDALHAYRPQQYDLSQKYDELRILKGVYQAFSGDIEAARMSFINIVESATTPESIWIQAAQNAYDAYQSQDDLYRMCSAIDVCVDYFTFQMGGPDVPPCVYRNICDYGQSIRAALDTAFPTSPLDMVIDNLKSIGVNIIHYGWRDFDLDNQAEIWFLTRYPHTGFYGRVWYQLWIAGQYSEGVKVLLVDDEIIMSSVVFKVVPGSEGRVITDYGHGKTIELVRHPDTGEPLITVRTIDAQEPVDERVSRFKELRKMLYEGNDPVMVYKQLAVMDDQFTKCPFSVRYWDDLLVEPDWRVRDEHDCATFYFTVAFAAELAGQENEAVRRYHAVWAQYPDSPFALLAQHKLVDK
ncbi:MAG: hypothetical protein JXR32_02590, partial [Anaerolineaceae bacterium]|nr:hypothetical protein [Anaerolineaceae bacterium]